MANEKIIVTENKNKVIVSTPGPQGPRGKTILNGSGAPSGNLGTIGDFYYDISTTRFYGPKTSEITWDGVPNFLLQDPASDYARVMSWELTQVHYDSTNQYYYVDLQHDLNFYPNVTIKDSGNELVETGIEYVTANKITLTMAQPFSGKAYLS
jgi:hypothetical protein